MQNSNKSIMLSRRAHLGGLLANTLGKGLLFFIASTAAIAVLFIFYFIARDSIPFISSEYIGQFFSSREWYPSGSPPAFGALPLFVGSGLVTLGACILAVPLGVSAAVCLSDVIPFELRQFVKPVIEMLAAIPSVAYGFFALVVLAPLLQNDGGRVLATIWFAIAVPVFIIAAVILSDLLTTRIGSRVRRNVLRTLVGLLLLAAAAWAVVAAGGFFNGLEIKSGTNALNVSFILGIMALPTIVSVSEDALQAVGRELREGSTALGATRAETLVKTIIPAASSGIFAAVLLGIMRALGETMVVWMASGNAAQIPEPIYNYLEPVRTLTATIAGDMGEADHVTGSARYHVLFTIGLCLLAFCFVTNLASEWIVARQRRKLRGE
jgi:phosphate transport system permease protein